jgi:hypothetical protein
VYATNAPRARTERCPSVERLLATTQSWDYDPAGNRDLATANGVTNDYSANPVNEYYSITGFPVAPQHDDNGNATNWNVRPGGLPSAALLSSVFNWNINNELIVLISQAFKQKFFFSIGIGPLFRKP